MGLSAPLRAQIGRGRGRRPWPWGATVRLEATLCASSSDEEMHGVTSNHIVANKFPAQGPPCAGIFLLPPHFSG